MFQPSLLAQVPVFLCLLDTEGRHLWVNVIALGWTSDDVIGKCSTDFVAEDDRANWAGALRRCMIDREIISGTVRGKSPTELVAFRYFLSPVTVEGVVTGCWSVCWPEHENPLYRFILSPLSEAALSHLLANGNAPLKGAALGIALKEAVGGQASQKLRVTLGGLVDRHILQHTPNGYVISEEFLRFYRPLSPISDKNFLEKSPNVK